MTRKWTAAGVRVDRVEAERRIRASAVARNQVVNIRAKAVEEGQRLWAAGRLVPAAITMSLDAKDLEGPQVDLDCGASEPDVDHWEAGILYPTWEQTVALADLCQVPVRMLADRWPFNAGNIFMCGGPGGGRRPDPAPILVFTQAALEARLNPPQPELF